MSLVTRAKIREVFIVDASLFFVCLGIFLAKFFMIRLKILKND